MENFENATIRSEDGDVVLENVTGHISEGAGWILLSGRPEEHPLKEWTHYVLDTGSESKTITIIELRHSLMVVGHNTEVHFRLIGEDGKMMPATNRD